MWFLVYIFFFILYNNYNFFNVCVLLEYVEQDMLLCREWLNNVQRPMFDRWTHAISIKENVVVGSKAPHINWPLIISVALINTGISLKNTECKQSAAEVKMVNRCMSRSMMCFDVFCWCADNYRGWLAPFLFSNSISKTFVFFIYQWMLEKNKRKCNIIIWKTSFQSWLR